MRLHFSFGYIILAASFGEAAKSACSVTVLDTLDSLLFFLGIRSKGEIDDYAPREALLGTVGILECGNGACETVFWIFGVSSFLLLV